MPFCMTDSENFEKIKKAIGEIISKSENRMQDYHAFIYWFINTLYGYSEEQISKALCDGTHDRGIDACVIDNLEKTVTLIQSKYERQGNDRTQNESEVQLFSSIDNYFESSSSLENAIASANERTRSLLKEAYYRHDKERYFLEAIFITTHRRNVVIDKEVETTFKPHNIDSLKVFYFDDMIAFYGETERNFLPMAPPFELRYEPGSAMLKKGDAKAWVFTVKAEEIRRLAMKYDIDVLFRKNVRNFLGRSETNKGISDTLKDENDNPNFWFYNNGVTILCREARNDSDNNSIRLVDPQVINGCQTVVSIKNFSGRCDADLLVRVIATTDNELIGRVVLYQNSSNPVRKRDLKSNDPIQVRLHREFLKRRWFYEMKKGETFQEVTTRTPQLKNLCKASIDNRQLAKVIASVKLNPALAVGQGEDYYFGEKYEDIFTNDLSVTFALGVMEIEWLIQDDIRWSDASFHDYDKEWKFKKPAHYIINRIFYDALCKIDYGIGKFVNFVENNDEDSTPWVNLISALKPLVGAVYELIFNAYNDYHSKTKNYHTVYFKNQEEINLFFNNYKEEINSMNNAIVKAFSEAFDY